MPHPTQSRTTAIMLTLFPILLAQALPARSARPQEVGERFRDCPTGPEMAVVPAAPSSWGRRSRRKSGGTPRARSTA